MESEQNEEVAARLLEFVDRMEDLVGVCDEHGRVLYLNQAARKQLGIGAASELTTADFFAPEAFASYYDEVRPALLRSGTWTGELPILTQGGDSVAMLFSVVAGVAPGGEITGLVTHGRPLPDATPVTARDAGDNASHIIDRDIVVSRLSEALERNTEGFVAVVYAEVRDMRSLTQRHGGFVADGVMRTVGRRLTSTVRASDFVGRVGRNAFFVLCTDTRDAAEAMRLVQSLEDAFHRELIWSVAGELSISLRCGLAIAERGDDPEAALRHAQLASTSATRVSLDPVEASDDPTLVAACEALRPAVMTGDVQTLVGTVVDRAGRVAGYHAFARWSHSELGVWESHRLDAIARRAGVSTAVALRVLREAAAFVMTSPADATTSISVALPESLMQDAYVEQYLWEVVDAVGIAPGQIALLVDAATGPGSSQAALRSMRETGAKVVATGIDRGSDVIALVADHHFLDLRLHERIVEEIDADTSARTAVLRILALAHDVGARVTAPGVTTNGQRQFLLDAGVDLMAGEFFGASLPAEAVT